MNMCVGNKPSLLSVWLQLLQGSVRLARGWETSTRGGVGGGLGFFQPLHLQFSVWKKTHFLCNSENINSVFNKSYVVFALYFGISEIKCQMSKCQKNGWENFFAKGDNSIVYKLFTLQDEYTASFSSFFVLE